MKRKADIPAAVELRLYAVNDGETYRAVTTPVIENLARKIAAGSYDPSKAGKAWVHVADYSAQRYTKEFCSGSESSYGCFTKPTREYAAGEIAEYYTEQLTEKAAEYRLDRKNKEVWTLSAIKQRNETVGKYFFSRDTMKFFGDTMASFGVHCSGGKIYVVRIKPMRDRDGRSMGGVGDKRLFDPETGEISTVIREDSNNG